MSLTLGMLAGNEAVQPFFINAVSGATSPNQVGMSWAHTTDPRTAALVVGVYAGASSGNNSSLTGAWFNNVPMTLIRQNNQGNLTTGMYVLFNPPIGTFNVSVTADGSGRGFAASSLALGGVKVIDAETGGGGSSTNTNPYSTSLTAPTGGIAVANVGVRGNSGLSVSATSPQGIILAAPANVFTSDGNTKYQALFYLPTLVGPGASTLTANASSASGRGQQFVIFK